MNDIDINKYKELIVKFNNDKPDKNWTLDELRDFSKAISELNDKFNKLDNVENFMRPFNDYINKNKYDKDRKQDLLKFVKTITNYDTKYDEYRDADTSSYEITLETSNFNFNYEAYWQDRHIYVIIESEEMGCEISIYPEYHNNDYTDDIGGNVSVLKEVYDDINFQTITYDEFLTLLCDIIKFQKHDTHKLSEWRYMRQMDLDHLKTILL
jgi:hypothetical protein